MKILLIEDEIKIAEFTMLALTGANFTVTHVSNGAAGLAAMLDGDFDLVVLDVMLPSLDGFEVLKKARELGNKIPVVFLTAKGELPYRLKGFEIGGDDYISKPFFAEELVARVRAIKARINNDDLDEITVNQVCLNKVSNRVFWRGTSTPLSQREFSLIEFLMRSPGHIFSRKQILQHVWAISFNPETNVVDVYIQRIRKKLNRNSPSGIEFPIETIRGVGYRFRLESKVEQ
jgi:two-component system OmpR family response regulator